MKEKIILGLTLLIGLSSVTSFASLTTTDAQQGVEINENWTPLHKAAYEGNIEKVRDLVKHAAKLGVKTNKGWTALHFAAYNGMTETARFLIWAAYHGNAATVGHFI